MIPWLILIAVLVTSIPLYAHAVSVPEIPDPSMEFSITGAGASFPYPLIDLWRVEYNKEFSNVYLNYQSIGSGGGVKQHIEKTVNFAASDAPLKQSEKELAQGTLHIPEAIGGVVITYNIPQIPEKGLKLTGEIIADIYLGKITRWNDSQIAQYNPELSLPDEEIIVAKRSDGSGTTFVFTDYLSTQSSEFEQKIGKAKAVPWPLGVGAAGNEGVAGIVRNTPHSIGYVELAYAFQTGMSFAFVENGDKTGFIEPTLETISAASKGASANLPAAEGDWSKVSIVNAPGEKSYPIASFTYLLLYDELSNSTNSIKEAKTIIHMMHWMITDGQNHSESLLYVPLSDEVIEIGKQGLARVTYEGEILFDYDGPVENQNDNNADSLDIPSWIKDNARWWADGLISDEEYIAALQYLIEQGILKV
ncbi:MAG: phosphate ABC transporter substrate-binding protein PstS [Thaumarchaeota archaeon]|nr:phosphate ABC transporter substrate-binding protein PstS [Nitrososphaerota archaeon]